MAKKKLKMPKMSQNFIPIKDIKIGQKVFFTSRDNEPFEVVKKSSRMVEVITVELRNSKTKLVVSGNKYVSTEPIQERFGS